MVITLQRVIRSPSCLVLGWVFGDGGSNGAISGWIKSKMAAGGHFEKRQVAISNVLAMCHPIDFMFGSRVEFSTRMDGAALFRFH